MNLKDLDFKAIDKEIETDEVAQATATTGEDPSRAEKDGDDVPPS